MTEDRRINLELSFQKHLSFVGENAPERKLKTLQSGGRGKAMGSHRKRSYRFKLTPGKELETGHVFQK